MLSVTLHIDRAKQHSKPSSDGICKYNVGRGELANAVTRCGGFSAVARHLSLPVTETRGRKRSTA